MAFEGVYSPPEIYNEKDVVFVGIVDFVGFCKPAKPTKPTIYAYTIFYDTL